MPIEPSGVLTELGCHPKVGAALVVAMGCEGTPYREMVDSVLKSCRAAELI
jgi:altronate dehydratase